MVHNKRGKTKKFVMNNKLEIDGKPEETRMEEEFDSETEEESNLRR